MKFSYRIVLTGMLAALLCLGQASPGLAQTFSNTNYSHQMQQNSASATAASGAFASMEAEDTGICLF